MEKEETQNHIERSSLWTDIFTIVKQLPRRNVEGDAPDAFSVSTDIEMLIAAREARLVEALEGWVDYHKSLRGGQIAGCPGNGYGGSCTDSGGYPDGLDNANPSQICDFHKLLRSTHKALAEYRGEK